MTQCITFYTTHKDDIHKFIDTICKKLETQTSYTPFVVAILEDFFAKYDYEFITETHFMYYTEIAVVAAIWIIDKYIEDDHLYLTDLSRMTVKHIKWSQIIKVESDIFFICTNIRKYIN